MSIDFSKYETTTNDEPVALSQLAIDESHSVTFDAIEEVGEGSLLAKVTTELEGDILWLYSQDFGAQNGFNSLKKAADGAENIVGGTFTYTRVSSEKSPAGYAHRWTA